MTVMSAFDAAIVARLGRCVRCVRLSVGLTLIFAALLVALMAAEAGTAVILIGLALAIAFGALAAAHAVAYVVRGPGQVADCAPCAEKAKAHRRATRA
jgi:hypothetical protein